MTQTTDPNTLSAQELGYRATSLWKYLDDIDTCDDMAKDDDALFRRLVRHRAEKRHRHFVSEDGYTLLAVVRDPAAPADRSAEAASASPAVDRDMTSPLDRDKPEADHPRLVDEMFVSRYGGVPIAEVRSWPADKVAALASWLGEVLRWELNNRQNPQPLLNPKYLGETSQRYQHVFDIHDTDPDAIVAAHNRQLGARIEPKMPEAAAHPERVRPTTSASVAGGPNLVGQLQAVLNRCSAENGSNTPDFILAEMMVEQLAAYNRAVRKRAEWYGRMDEPGRPWTLIPDDVLKALADDELRRIHDLVHERRLRLQIESDDPVSYVDVIRGLVEDALVPATDARDMAALRARAEAAEHERHETVERIAKYKTLADTAVATVDQLRITAPELLDLHKFVHRELAPLDPNLDRRNGESDIAWATRLLRVALDRGAFRLPSSAT